jgi:hypothetical protein
MVASASEARAPDAVGAGAVIAASDARDASIPRRLQAKGGGPDANPIATFLIRAAASKSTRTVKWYPCSSGHPYLDSGSIAKATRGKQCAG